MAGGVPEAAPPPAGRLPLKRLLLVLGLGATAYAAVLLLWSDSPGAALGLLWSWTGLKAGVLCLLSYLLRGLRWRLWMVHYGRHFGWLEGLRIYLAGYAFTPTPGNVGEALRGLLPTRRPLSAAQSLAIFGAERLADLLCLLLLSLPAVSWFWGHGLIREVLRSRPQATAAVVTGMAILIVLAVSATFFYRRQWLGRLAWLNEAIQCLKVRPLVWFALTLAAWAAQGLAVWLLCTAMGLQLPLLTATGFYALAMVAGALSALPAGLGGTEAALAGLLVAQSATPEIALAITLMARLLTLWLAVAIGMATLFYGAAIRKDISFK